MIRRLFVPFLALVLAATPLTAQDPPPDGKTFQVDPEAKAAIDRIRSPFCPGLMLAVCTSSGGAMLRDSIQRMAEAGLGADSIVEIVIGEYGEEWRAEPLRTGVGLWAWLLPPLALVGGLGAVAVVLARRRSRLDEDAPPPADTNPEDEARLRAALKQMDEEQEPVF